MSQYSYTKECPPTSRLVAPSPSGSLDLQLVEGDGTVQVDHLRDHVVLGDEAARVVHKEIVVAVLALEGLPVRERGRESERVRESERILVMIR